FIQHVQKASGAPTYLAKYVSGGASFQAGVQTDYTVNWSNITHASNTVIPPTYSGNQASGHSTKCQLATYGGTEILFLALDAVGPVYAQLVSKTTAESDWEQRSTAAGVVWAHDFRDDDEVNAFRWRNGIGNNPEALGT